jgi:tripartite-type tricarboxylate transporter receptor subunit TctC
MTEKTRMNRFAAILSLVIVVIACQAPDACAQAYPNRPIKLIIPFAAGGAVDVLARVLAAKLGEGLGQTVIVESRPGAGGNIATDAVAKSPPDGYTILQTTNGFAITPALYRKLPFSPSDFAPVTQLVSSMLVLVASPKFDVRSFADFVARAKAKPGALNYGSSGVGNPLHLTMEMFKHAAGVDIVAIPYKSDGEINNALMSGDVQAAVVPLATARTLIEAGKIRGLAVTGAKRAEVAPEIPTVAESGVPGFASSSWQGFFVAAKTPHEVVVKIQQETAKVLHLPDVAERLRSFAYEPVGSTTEEFSTFFQGEIDKFAKVIKDANIPMQN